MTIEFECPSCLTKLRVSESTAGKLARCPQCQSLVSIPGPDGTAQPPEPPVASYQPAAKPMPSAGYPPNNNPYAANLNSAPPVPPSTRERLEGGLTASGIVLLVSNLVVLFGCLLMLLGFLIKLVENDVDDEDIFTLLFIGGMALLQIIGILGAVSMLRRKSYRMAMTGTICTMCSGLCCCFFPTMAAIYPVTVLASYQTRSLFQS